MRTRSSSNPPGESSPNPTSSNPKRRNRRRSKQPFILEESPVVTMADQRTMAELLRTPIEGYAEAIMVPPILADRPRFFEFCCRWQSFGKTYSRCVDDYRQQIQAKLTHAVNQQTSAVTTAMTTILKQFQATPPPAFVKAVQEICVTCGGAHPYYLCLATDGNTFAELRHNIQGYVSVAAVNFNQGNSSYRPPGVAIQIRPPCFAQPNVQNNQNRFSQPLGYNRRNNFNQDSSYQAQIHQNQVVPLTHLKEQLDFDEFELDKMNLD
uniref:Reverse transcriptase domain-containing protein n=1 Tax=Tanacetum cinerariifolium TaxID=118510 RepID=A0A699H891_TANCI|nr:hypothetical protein [Tanacetum cinerariifolium]